MIQKARTVFIAILLFLQIPFLFAQANKPFTGPVHLPFEKGLSVLPNKEGQIWISYDISSYTKNYPNVSNPQRTLLNWILLDTGPDFWHQEPFSVLTADRNRLYVYHTPQVQQYVSNVLDRFMDPKKKNEFFSIRILLVQTPDWRTRAAEWIRPWPVKSKDIQGWLLRKEIRNTFVAELAKRSDFLELNTAKNQVPHGETYGWVLAGAPKKFVRDIQIAADQPIGYIADSGSVDEGYRIEATPLLSTDGTQVEIAFRCQSTVVEKMLSFHLKIPTKNAPRQQLEAELPQILNIERKEKISFPKDLVFLFDLGMIPLLIENPQNQNTLMGNLSKMVSGKSIYYNVLVLIEAKEGGISD
ncbi:MAG: hypothetical protein Q4G69_00230 [Planctomycetia bacterium]|nr:hypothetical protein [Planctomycetia bacterium]